MSPGYSSVAPLLCSAAGTPHCIHLQHLRHPTRNAVHTTGESVLRDWMQTKKAKYVPQPCGHMTLFHICLPFYLSGIIQT